MASRRGSRHSPNDQLGHANPSMTQDVHFARKMVQPAIAAVLEDIFEDRLRRKVGKVWDSPAAPIGAHALTYWFGSPDWTRTSNPSINSRMLCQLSYGGLTLRL